MGALLPASACARRLLVAGFGVLHLDPLFFDQRDSGHQLQVSAGDGEHHFLTGLARIKTGGVRGLPRRTIVMERGESPSGLLQRSANIVVMKRPDGSGKAKFRGSAECAGA